MNNDFRQYSELYHHGVKGMKWGVRRYQNPDGSLTPEGKRRYFNPDGSLTREGQKHLNKRFGVSKARGALRIGAGVAGLGAFNAVAGTFNKVRHVTKANNYLMNRSKQIGATMMKSFGNANMSDKLKNVLAKRVVERVAKDPEYIKHVEKAFKFEKYAKNGLIALGVGAAVAGIALHKYHKNKKRLEQNGRQYIDLMRTGKMQAKDSDSAVTKRVKNDYNNLTDQQFMNKYGASKSTYMKRVNKYGDPYMNSPLAKMGKALNKNAKSEISRQRSKIDKQRTALKEKEFKYTKNLLEQYKQEGRDDLEIAVGPKGDYIIQNKDPKKRKANLKGYRTVKI